MPLFDGGQRRLRRGTVTTLRALGSLFSDSVFSGSDPALRSEEAPNIRCCITASCFAGASARAIAAAAPTYPKRSQLCRQLRQSLVQTAIFGIQRVRHLPQLRHRPSARFVSLAACPMPCQ